MVRNGEKGQVSVQHTERPGNLVAFVDVFSGNLCTFSWKVERDHLSHASAMHRCHPALQHDAMKSYGVLSNNPLNPHA